MELFGFRRENGDIGIRNYIAIIAAMDNSIPVVRRIAQAVTGAISITPSFGANMLAHDYKQHLNTLIGLGTNPNVFGAVVISQDLESSEAVTKEIIKTGRPALPIGMDDIGGSIKAYSKAVRFAQQLANKASKMRREKMNWSELIVGVECGGSDGSSGVASNPVLGLMADRIVDRGGTIILSETLEVLGAEHILAAQAKNEAVAKKLIDVVNSCVEYCLANGYDAFASNPDLANRQGGLSTIEEKALGAIKKGGSRTLQEVVGYGEKPSCKGLIFMDAPCAAVENMTALASGGCHAILYSTGKGNPCGNPVSPTIHVSGNPNTVIKHEDNIDVDISAVISSNMSMKEATDMVEEEFISVCNGKLTKVETLGDVEVAISRLARSL